MCFPSSRTWSRQCDLPVISKVSLFTLSDIPTYSTQFDLTWLEPALGLTVTVTATRSVELTPLFFSSHPPFLSSLFTLIHCLSHCKDRNPPCSTPMTPPGRPGRAMTGKSQCRRPSRRCPPSPRRTTLFLSANISFSPTNEI